MSDKRMTGLERGELHDGLPDAPQTVQHPLLGEIRYPSATPVDVKAEVERMLAAMRGVSPEHACTIGDVISPLVTEKAQLAREVERLRAEIAAAPATDLQRVCVVPLITDDADRLLLIRHARRGTWELPGGKKRPDEKWRYATRREGLEETGLGIVLAAGAPYDVLDGECVPGAGYPSTILIVRARAEGEPTPGDDAAEARWFTRDEIPWDDLSKIGSAEVVRRWAETPAPAQPNAAAWERIGAVLLNIRHQTRKDVAHANDVLVPRALIGDLLAAFDAGSVAGPSCPSAPLTEEQTRGIAFEVEVEGLLQSIESVDTHGWTLATGNLALVKAPDGHLTVIHTSQWRGWVVKLREILAAARGEHEQAGRAPPMAAGDSERAALSTRAVVTHPHSTLDARHALAQHGDDVVASESWHDANGVETKRYAVRLPLSRLVHLALNTTAEERAEIDARADWRGVPPDHPRDHAPDDDEPAKEGV